MIAIFIRVSGCVPRCGWPLLLLLLAGCSSKGAITGKITYQGKPLPVGSVTFVPEQGGGGFTSEIQNGEYKLTKVPVGPVKIAVATPPQAPPSQYVEQMRPPAEILQKTLGKSPEDFSAPSAQARKPVPIPEKFKDPNTSGLTYTVKSGSQVHDIDLPAK